MSGTYTDIPGPRMDLANDGTKAFGLVLSTGAWTDLTTQLAGVQECDPVAALGVPSAPYLGTGVITCYLYLLFPETRNLRGLYWGGDGGTGGTPTVTVHYSLDTTDGVNGTWTAIGANGFRALQSGTLAYPNFRTAIAALSLDNVKGLRFGQSNALGSTTTINWRQLHVYGTRSPSVDRIAFWHPTSDQELSGAYFDQADLVRGSVSGSRQFRLKNLSATKNATGLVVNAAGAAGSNFGSPGLQVSADNAAWGAATPGIALAAGAISPILYARVNLADTTLAPQARAGRLFTSLSGYA